MRTNPILVDIPTPITTPRLLLRPPQPGDGAELNAAILETFDELEPWIPWAKERPSLAESEEDVRRAYARWILREDLRLPMFERESGKLVGSSGLHRINWEVPSFEIGYWVRKSSTGKGYATESTNAMTRFAFAALHAHRVELKCDARNEKSIRVIERLGFELEGRLRGSMVRAASGEIRDLLVYSRLDAHGLPPLDVRW